MANPWGSVYQKRNIIDRLEERTIINKETNCWDFQGTVGHAGHASIWYLGKMRRVNRISAHLFLGMILEDYHVVCHRDNLCKSKRCWNPDHLYVGTQADNVADSIEAGTHSMEFWKARWAKRND